ncbi:serine/threonine-protein kinase [Dactylosporangium sp. NPDC051484]|uniref:serine/threonine-protein kinase n=1 Tax=Dactylosporangium sp. NPDC051484 TaxID=3154942 RepID=UPI00344C3741
MTRPKALIAERYRLIESLGAGGMGRVWLARDEVLRRDVAIKEVIPPESLTPDERDELRMRTLREARAAARLNDANVVRIYDVVHTEQAPWIVMEYVPSRSLHQVIAEDGPLPPDRVVQIGLAVLAALKAAHGAGVLHRDVKPGNVLLADTGRVVLTDFGLAVFEGGDGAVTRPGLILGSPQYISPERAREGTSGPESDMWALGATLYAAVEGRSPYARSTTYATLTALATEEPDPPTRAGVLKPVLGALLRKDPRARADVAETERLLQRAAAGEGRGWPWGMPALPRTRRAREGQPGASRNPSGGALWGYSRGPADSGGASAGGADAASPAREREAAAVEAITPVSAAPAAASDVSPEPITTPGITYPGSTVPGITYPGRAKDSAAVPPASDDPPPAVALHSADDDLDRTVPPHQRWRWVAAGVAVLALVVAATLYFSDSGDGTEQDARPPGTSGAVAQAAPAAPSASTTPSPVVEGSIGGSAIQLPEGYEWVTDPKFGWRVGLPTGWIRIPHPTSDSMIYFVNNTDPRMRVGFDTSERPPLGDPKQDWEKQERDRLNGRMYANYQRIKIVDVDGYRGTCADWQWSYDSSRGHMRVSNLGCRIRSNLGQAIYWECPAEIWGSPPVQQIYDIIKASFQPRPA